MEAGRRLRRHQPIDTGPLSLLSDPVSLGETDGDLLQAIETAPRSILRDAPGVARASPEVGATVRRSVRGARRRRHLAAAR
jgi:hypothetical protein